MGNQSLSRRLRLTLRLCLIRVSAGYSSRFCTVRISKLAFSSDAFFYDSDLTFPRKALIKIASAFKSAATALIPPTDNHIVFELFERAKTFQCSSKKSSPNRPLRLETSHFLISNSWKTWEPAWYKPVHHLALLLTLLQM